MDDQFEIQIVDLKTRNVIGNSCVFGKFRDYTLEFMAKHAFGLILSSFLKEVRRKDVETKTGEWSI